MDLEALFLTSKLAATITPLLIAIASPAAFILSFNEFRLKRILIPIINLPLFIPPTVLGFFLMLLMSPDSLVGKGFEYLTGKRLLFSYTSLVIAMTISNFPYALQPLLSSFEKTDIKLIEKAEIMGFSKTGFFFMVILPTSLKSIAAAATMVFARCLGEFGVILIVGGGIPGKTKVASISIFEAIETLNYNGAYRMSLVLLMAGTVFSFLISFLASERGKNA